MMYELLVKFPTRNRPAVFRRTFELYRNMRSGKRNVHFLISLDVDDSTMNNTATLQWLRGLPNVSVTVGANTSKVQAINADLAERADTFDVLLLASDDMLPVTQGYDDIICTDMRQHFPGLNGVLHYNDGRLKGNTLNTLSIMGRNLYKQWGHIYHEDYIALWCDNEFQAVSERDKQAVFIDRTIIEHAWTKATGQDELHKRNEAFYRRDEAVFNIRREHGFPRESCLQFIKP